MHLYRLDQERMCVFVRADGSHGGVFVVAPSVHEALPGSADKLLSGGVWIDVTAERKWLVQGISDGRSRPQGKNPHSERIENQDDLDRQPHGARRRY